MMEEASGGRMHYMFNRVGGLKEDLPGRLARAGRRRRSPPCAGGCPTSRACSSATRSCTPAPAGSACCRPAIISAYGVSGPIARASGVDLDLRRDEPYLAYAGLFDGRRPGPGGHPHRGRLPGAARGAAGADPRQPRPGPACLEVLAALPQGPVNVKLPKVLRVPEGTLYTATENPLGFNGYYLVSRGDKTPWRLKLRSASFNNISVLGEVLPGNLIADMVAILGSMFFVVGDIDK